MNDFEARVEAIKNFGTYVTTPHGGSMRPMMTGERDSVVIGEAGRPLAKYDVCLFMRQDGCFVIHRLIKIKKDGLVFRGDNCFFCEKNIPPENVIGIMRGFYRKDKFVPADKKSYALYSRLWCFIYPLRWIWHCVSRAAQKIIRKTFRKKREI